MRTSPALLVAACCAFVAGGCRSSVHAVVAPPRGGEEHHAISAAAVRQIELGMTRHEVLARLGSPEYVRALSGGSANSEAWEYERTDGSALHLIFDEASGRLCARRSGR